MHIGDSDFLLVDATPALREQIYQARHQIYALEIGQHPPNSAKILNDHLDRFNHYLAVTKGSRLAGFISVTPPNPHGYSVDKYFSRSELPFKPDSGTFEIRLLTVMPDFRKSIVAAALMIAAFRWIEKKGGTRILAIGRRSVKTLYLKVGLLETEQSTTSGAVTYDLMHATVPSIRARLDQSRHTSLLEKRLSAPSSNCFHGGAFFEAIGPEFANLDRRYSVINADVLDAWFPPAPQVIEALTSHLPWLLQTSPPTACEGLVAAISEAREMPPSFILQGAGSSDLIFRVLPHWLTKSSRVLTLDPTYGEYVHVLEKVIGCHVERLPLTRANHYDPDLDQLKQHISTAPDLVILVNPNSPTGRVISTTDIESLLSHAPPSTRFWIDETYTDYAGQTTEPLTELYPNLVVCKSMSKAYALSGARVAYLCAHPDQLAPLRTLTPPWLVSLPSQVAAVAALREPNYYKSRWQQTHQLRKQLAASLQLLGWDTVDACANFILAHLPPDGPTTESIIASCRSRNLFLRNPAPMGHTLDEHTIRIAVKDTGTNKRMLEILNTIPTTESSPSRPDHPPPNHLQ